MTAAKSMRDLALKNKPSFTEGEVKTVTDDFVKGIYEAAQQGLLGTPFSIEVMRDDVLQIVHAIGDLRGGGFSVDVVSILPGQHSDQVALTLFVTW